MIKKIGNKYLITFVAFLLWLLFFDKNDLFTQIDMKRQLRKLIDEKKYYKLEIDKNQSYINELKNNPESIERYAREKYMMKKDNEDVYVFVTR